MSAPQVLIPSEPTLLDVQYLEDRISEFNAGVTGISDGELLASFLKDESGRIIAGICAPRPSRRPQEQWVRTN
jgi:hypothetical protein